MKKAWMNRPPHQAEMPATKRLQQSDQPISFVNLQASSQNTGDDKFKAERSTNIGSELIDIKREAGDELFIDLLEDN
jgi:hypothetical protein